MNGGTHSNPEAYTVEDKITLTEPTRTGYTFTGWAFDGQAEPIKNVTISKGSTGAKSYTANWSINSYTLTIQKNIDGAGSVSGAGTYVFGSTATLSAKSYLGYTFVGWYDANGLLIDANTTCSYVVGVNPMVIAKYAVSSEMKDFVFNSTETTCQITGVQGYLLCELHNR